MIKINFITLEAGWIKGEIVTEEKKMYFDYSWISNFLNDLLKATLSIGGYIEGMNREKFTAYWEPAIDDWLLYKKENNLIIQINCFEDETRKKQIETTKIQCDYIEFIKTLFDGLTKLIKRVGIYGYRTEWDEEFPLSLYLKLYDIIYDKNYLDLKEWSLEETYCHGSHVSNISNELALLNEIFK